MPGMFADKPLIEPMHLYQECLRVGYPVDWWGKANRFENRAGVESGTGAVLMLRKHLDEINLNRQHDLEFSDGDLKTTLKNLHIAGPAVCVTPGKPGAEEAVYLVPLADKRRRMKLATCNRGFNMRVTPTGNYATGTSTDPNTPYTWEEIEQLIWEKFPSAYAGASSPGIPYSPDEDPEEFGFHGMTTSEAYAHFSDRLGYQLVLDVVRNTFSSAKTGDVQDGLDTLEDLHIGKRQFDREPIDNSFGSIPADVEVYFRKEPEAAYGTNPFKVVTVNVGSTSQGEEGTLRLYDDLPAMYQGKSLENEAALNERALDRSTEFMRQRREYLSGGRVKVYSGAIKDFVPGEMVQSVTWQDLGGDPNAGGGMTTTVTRFPVRDPMAEWPGNPVQKWRLVEMCQTIEEADPYWSANVRIWNTLIEDWETIVRCWLLFSNDTDVPKIGRFYLARFMGYYSGRPVYATYCCPATNATPPGEGGDGGDGDPPGEFGTLTTTCCDELLPETMYVTLTNVSGCACLDGLTFAINYDSTTSNPWYWRGRKQASCGWFALDLFCSGGTWNLGVGAAPADCVFAINLSNPVVYTCPDSAGDTVAAGRLDVTGCCTGTVSIAITT